jgi:hypothetical protein
MKHLLLHNGLWLLDTTDLTYVVTLEILVGANSSCSSVVATGLRRGSSARTASTCSSVVATGLLMEGVQACCRWDPSSWSPAAWQAKKASRTAMTGVGAALDHRGWINWFGRFPRVSHPRATNYCFLFRFIHRSNVDWQGKDRLFPSVVAGGSRAWPRISCFFVYIDLIETN